MHKNILPLIAIAGIFNTLHASEQQSFEPKSAADCQPRINPTKLIPQTEDHDLVCLKNGWKNVFWGFRTLHFEKGINEQEWNNKTFGTLKFNLLSFINGEAKSFPQGAIIYRKNRDGERNALLLEKYLLENNLVAYSKYIETMASSQSQEEKTATIKKLFDNDNGYIVGMLLEYGEENVEFFYQDIAFGAENMYAPILTDADVQAEAKNVRSWAVANQNKWKPEFDKDKNMYKAWMTLNKDIPNATLRRQNEALSKAIGTLYYAR